MPSFLGRSQGKIDSISTEKEKQSYTNFSAKGKKCMDGSVCMLGLPGQRITVIQHNVENCSGPKQINIFDSFHGNSFQNKYVCPAI